MGFHRSENSSEQNTWRKNQITQTLWVTHANWSHTTIDDVDELCGPDNFISWLELWLKFTGLHAKVQGLSSILKKNAQ